MNRVIIDLDILYHNIKAVSHWMEKTGANWTLVTKVLCGHADTLRALQALGIRSMADSRLGNLQAIERLSHDLETWYLRLPHIPAIPDIISLSDVSLNSEIEVIAALNEEAQRQEKIHRIIVMIELGDLREGILPGSLSNFYQAVFDFSNIEMLGIGANLGCLSGSVPNIDQLTQLVLYRELLELKFERPLPMISAGSSAVLPLMLEGRVPKGINHYRIGEAVFLGTDLVHGGVLEGLRDDAITLEAQIVEIKEKSLVPLGETTAMTPFEAIGSGEEIAPGQRGYRAIVTVGQLDTEVTGLKPINPDYEIAGASSDLTVVNLGEHAHGLHIGDTLKFRVNYAALLRLMTGKYLDYEVIPEIDAFTEERKRRESIPVPPVLDQV